MLEKALEEDTRETSRKKPITTPELLKKSTGRITGEGSWSGGGGPSPPQASDWEDVSTEIGDPDQMAELMLKQGFVDRAIAIYERLVELNPKRDRYKQRLAEIKDMAQRGMVPAPLESPAEDQLTAQVDLSELPELAAMKAEEPLTAPAARRLPDPERAMDILDRMAPSLEAPVVLEDDIEIDDSAFGAEGPEWGEDDTTVVGSELDEEDHAATEPPPPGARPHAESNPFEHATATVLDPSPPRVPARVQAAPGGSVMVSRIILVR
jgi:hypothetical protein